MVKRYNNLNDYYRNKFGCKVIKVSLDSGLSCPNKDGTKGIGGCIFCNGNPGVGNPKENLKDQFETVKKNLSGKWPKAKYIPYLEANTNTYATLSRLKEMYEPLLLLDNVVGLDIATRCDSISEEVYDYLEDLSKRTFLTVELGLQSSHNESLKFINRGHTREEFAKCVRKLKKRNINVVVHIIDGLPNESEDMMLETIDFINDLSVDGIKFHMLYIEEGTSLASLYKKDPFHILTEEEYTKILAEQIERLNPNIVIHRLVSDPNRHKLIEPMWLLKKFELLNRVEKYFEDNVIVQGKKYKQKDNQ